jgi:energy-coupling factor transporter ATP-binding protein EcfA2
LSTQKAALRLTEFSVDGLFGEFNHRIPFSEDGRITSLIGPNGMGKTACLRLINALFRRNWSVFQTTEFSSISYRFNDGSTVLVEPIRMSDSETDVSDTLGVDFITNRPGLDAPSIWTPRNIEDPVRGRSLEAYLPFLRRINPKLWMDELTGSTINLQEVVESYGDRIPEQVRGALIERPGGPLSELCEQIDCHLIETQRLLVFAPDQYRRQAGGSGSTLAISRKAQILRNTIAKELADYASTSQSLDRSFPKRVLTHGPIDPSRNLGADLLQLDLVRKGLTEVGILEPELDDALPAPEQINAAVAAVLSVYVRDTREKLAVLAKLRDRIKLFKELIDSRFFPKTVDVDKKTGFIVRRNPEVEVPLEKLSSGEQHQLVLFFELLFELQPNALILIDEPELSLHVAWQKQFIPDLRRIIDLNKFDVLLATHSPQLIGEWDDTVVELGEVDL